jgi:FkbM family methyltransferase
MIHRASFKGHEFNIVEGSVHPAYSLACMQPGGEEYDFRTEHWDVKPGDVVVDAGASYGAYSLCALAAGAAQVWAFEPEPSVYTDLCRNLVANEWLAPRAMPSSLALWGKPERVNMAEYAPHWPRHTITGTYWAEPLDLVLGMPARIDWIKIDTEGSEEQVIHGALGTIDRLHPRLIIEAHSFLDQGIPDRCKALLPGYTWQDVPRGDVVMLIGEWR